MYVNLDLSLDGQKNKSVFSQADCEKSSCQQDGSDSAGCAYRHAYLKKRNFNIINTSSNQRMKKVKLTCDYILHLITLTTSTILTVPVARTTMGLITSIFSLQNCLRS